MKYTGRSAAQAPLREAVANPLGVESPCAACPVRPLAICAGLPNDDLHRLSAIVTRLDFAPGAPVFDEGEAAQFLYTVNAGALKVYKLLGDGRKQIIGFLFAGDFLGLSVTDVYAYHAETVTPAEICRFPRRQLETLLAEFPGLQQRLLGKARNELAIAQDQMVLLGRKTAKERLVTFLLMLSQRAQDRDEPADPIAVPITRGDIADYLGLTTETVSRTFTQLKKTRLITLLPGNMVELTDRDALAEIAEGF